MSPSGQGSAATLKGNGARLASEKGIGRLIRLFWIWKLVLSVVACASPGRGYDTSTQILLDQYHSHSSSWLGKLVEPVVLRLTRWDAIYFASTSERLHLYEQEWAFSWLFSKTTSAIARVFFPLLPLTPITKHALTGILVSVVSHLLAVLVLYALVYEIAPTTFEKKRQLAFVTACLHVVSPAGIFLQAPYGESTFALCNFSGLWSYVLATQSRFSSTRRARNLEVFYTILSGISFGAATAVRTNGLLSVLTFVWDVLEILPRVLQGLGTQRLRHNEEQARLAARFLATIAAGVLLATGFVAPQAIAYSEYCTSGNTRPWCSRIPPSIYSFVQEVYWDVGFLRYWKVSNLPLFALAFPMGWIMVETSFPALFQAHHINRVVNGSTAGDKDYQNYPPTPTTSDEKAFQHCLQRFALPQLVLVALAATSFHCQIINRISSGYPIWYLVVAIEMVEGRIDGDGQPAEGLFRMLGNYDRLPFAKPNWVVRGMAFYAVVQAALYGSFLPPA